MTARSLLAALIALVALLVATPGIAQVTEEKREQARERFARGLERLRVEDYAGAVAEFEEAYSLAPFAVIQFNLGLSYERLGKPVAAVTAMEQVLAKPGKLSPERVSTAKRVLAEQRERIGSIALEVVPADARIRVDGVDVDAKTWRVAAGTHYVEAVKRGYAPARRELTVAGQTTEAVRLELEPTDAALGQLWIRSNLPGAEIWLDDVRIGTTPLRQSVPVLPGEHEVELRREGYAPARDRITLGSGSTGEVTLEPIEDRARIEAAGGELVLEGDGTADMVLTIDGRRYGPYTGPIALAPGRHEVSVERAGFLPTKLRVDIEGGTTLAREVVLAATAETIADHNGAVALHQGFAWATSIVGVLLVGGGVGLTVHTESEVSDLEGQFEPLLAGGQRCDSVSPTYDPSFCEDLATSIDDARARRPIGYAMLGVGGAALITGIVLFATSPDSDRYAPELDGDPFAFSPYLAPSFDGAVMGLRGRF